MLQPKRTKFRKVHKGRNRGLALRGSTVTLAALLSSRPSVVV
jgi:large subunit ribosomal protein L16